MDFLIEILLQGWDLILYTLIPFIIVIGIMIFFHELGHFLLAKAFGVKVLKFALGYGPPFLTKQVGETEYSIRYFPLGGFVKMLGEDLEEEESDETPSPDDLGRSFTDVNVFKRIAIVAAGPIFNLVLAVFIFFWISFIVGTALDTPEVGNFTDTSAAKQAGLQKGDIILSIEGKQIKRWTDIALHVHDQAGNKLEFVISRGNEIVNLQITPREVSQRDIFGKEYKTGLIGIAPKIEKYKLWLSTKTSLQDTWMWIDLTFKVIAKLITRDIPLKTIGGPIAIGQMTGQITRTNLPAIFPFMAIISVNLGILNLFPIPILDGGVIIFLFIELIIRRPLSIKKRELAQKVGLSLLILLMAFVFYNDIVRLIQSVK